MAAYLGIELLSLRQYQIRYFTSKWILITFQPLLFSLFVSVRTRYPPSKPEIPHSSVITIIWGWEQQYGFLWVASIIYLYQTHPIAGEKSGAVGSLLFYRHAWQNTLNLWRTSSAKRIDFKSFFQRQCFGFNSYILVLFDAKYQSMGGCCIWLPTLAWSLQSVLLVRSLLLIFQFPRKQRNTCLLQKKTYQMGLIPTQDSAQKSKEIFDSPSEMHKKHLNRTDANLAPKNSTKHTWIAAWAIQIIIGRFICLLV